MSPQARFIHTLISENKKLREALTIAQQWIGREVTDIRLRKTKEATLEKTKLELQESDDEIYDRIKKYFGPLAGGLSEENIYLLIESEVNFHHAVRQKHIDGIMVTNIYQKILENIFEEAWISPFRTKYKKKRLPHRKNDLLEKTLYKVIHDDFRLSIGKIYQICLRLVEGPPSELVDFLRETIETSPLYQALSDGIFWELFKDTIDTRAFGEKRHTGKISFQDVRYIRERITGNYEQDGLLKLLLRYL